MPRLLVCVAVAALAAPAGAQVPPIPSPLQGPSLGARIGWAFPAGSADAGSSLASAFSGAMPIELDATWRFDRHFSAGFYLALAPAFAKNCPAGETCSGRFTRLGLQAAYTLDPQGSLRPWLGIGTGWEWLRTEEKVAAGTVTDRFSGFEWLNLQLGGDFALSPRFWMGPFVSVTFATFGDLESSAPGFPTVSGSIPSGDRRFHEWIQLGVKGHFEL